MTTPETANHSHTRLEVNIAYSTADAIRGDFGRQFRCRVIVNTSVKTAGADDVVVVKRSTAD
jgi:hypothetical protein